MGVIMWEPHFAFCFTKVLALNVGSPPYILKETLDQAKHEEIYKAPMFS